MNTTISTYWPSIKFTSFFLLSLWLVYSCGTKKTETASNEEEIAMDTMDKDVVVVSKTQFETGHMELGKISTQAFHEVVKANGMFAIPPENQAEVSTYFAGHIKDISLLPGHAVKKGQVLFTLENPEYVQIQQDFLEAKGRLEYLKSDYERQQTLLKDQVTSPKKMLKAKSDYEITLAQYESLKKKLLLMNIDANTLVPENIRSFISVCSPLNGYATAIRAGKGMYLQPSDVALTVINTADLHIELKIFEKDLPKVKKGQEIRFSLQHDPNTVYKGLVHLVDKAINEMDKTIEIHGDIVDEEDLKRFAPGMYVEAEIFTSTTANRTLPTDALVNIEDHFFALQKQNDTLFKKVKIKVGVSSDGHTQILNLSDFNETTEFLVKGAFDLITE